jgi:hypothetical protein
VVIYTAPCNETPHEINWGRGGLTLVTLALCDPLDSALADRAGRGRPMDHPAATSRTGWPSAGSLIHTGCCETPTCYGRSVTAIAGQPTKSGRHERASG